MILRLIVEGFLPFRERVEFPLANQGLVVVRGLNKVSASSNDNGSGKTSILHGLSFNWFGIDLKGRKADAVANRFTEGVCLTQTDMEDERGPWSVIRTRRPGKLWVEGDSVDLAPDSNMDVVQAYIESRLGFGYRTFMNAIVFGQGMFERFAHADQAEQMKMLDEIQGLDYSTPRRNATDWRKNLVTSVEEIGGDISLSNVTLAAKRSEVETLTGLRDSYERTKRSALAALEVRLKGLADTARATGVEVRVLDGDSKLLEWLRREENVLTEREAALSLARSNEEEAGAFQDEAGMNLRRFDEKLERLLTHAECPECLGVIGGDIETVKTRFEFARRPLAIEQAEMAEAYRKTLDDTRAALDAVEAQQAVMRKMVGGTDDLHQVIMRLELRCNPTAVKKLRARLLAENNAVDEMQASIARAKGETWDGSLKLADAEASVVLMTAKIAREQGRFDKATIAVGLADYCVEAFSDRGIRSLMVDNVADFVNDRMVEHLDALTAGEATNRMAATTALKKGGTKERISFTPSWVWGGEGSDSGSGGQDRRVDLATFASVQDLSESRSARPFPLKAYDEPFDALDSRGKEMACAWLREQAKKRTVLLITHSEELAGLANPDQTWTIEHDENGARCI